MTEESLPGLVPSKVDLTVGVVTRGRRVQLLACVQSIVYASTYATQAGITVELIIVEDDATEIDPALQKILKSAPDLPYRYVGHRTRLGRTHGRNEVLDFAKGEFVAFVDDDNQIFRDLLKSLVEFARTREFGTIGTIGYYAWEPSRVWNSGTRLSRVTGRNIPVHARADYYEVDLIPNVFMFRRTDLHQLGLAFDERFSHHEEAILEISLQLHGKHNHIVATSGTLHDIPETGVHMSVELLTDIWEGRVYVWRVARNLGALTVLPVTFPAYCLYYCAAYFKSVRPRTVARVMSGGLIGVLRGLSKQLQQKPAVRGIPSTSGLSSAGTVEKR